MACSGPCPPWREPEANPEVRTIKSLEGFFFFLFLFVGSCIIIVSIVIICVTSFVFPFLYESRIFDDIFHGFHMVSLFSLQRKS